MEIKNCTKCGDELPFSMFATEKRGEINRILAICIGCHKRCRKEASSKYYQKNKNSILLKGKARYYENIDEEYIRHKKYRENNLENIKARRAKKSRQKRIDDVFFRISTNVSRSIRGALKINGGSKGGLSFLNKIWYTINDLKEHLAKKFESWMNWNNYGQYNKKMWNDYDQSTWTWNIDHIIPQSKLPYKSMEDDNFKKCWSLDNLRPLSSKQNFLNGIELLRLSNAMQS